MTLGFWLTLLACVKKKLGFTDQSVSLLGISIPNSQGWRTNICCPSNTILNDSSKVGILPFCISNVHQFIQLETHQLVLTPVL